jgi:hypothetical protein
MVMGVKSLMYELKQKYPYNSNVQDKRHHPYKGISWKAAYV